MFFFFKQKTAYDMRISDWSSDVCSSDLRSAPDRAACPWLRLRLSVDAGPSWHLHQAARAPTRPSPAAIWIDCARPVAPSFAAALRRWKQIGRESCRERRCQYVYISVGARSLKKKTKSKINNVVTE